MENSYLTAGMRLGMLYRLILRNKVSLSSKSLIRIFFLTQSAFWSSFFSSIEKIRYRRILDEMELPSDPIFIVGHWRTGSTYLHQLMTLNPAFTSPTLFQVAIPDSFLFSYNYYKPVFRLMVSSHRPMDNVRLGMNEPQEDEYAIYRLTGCSPIERLVFPSDENYFLTGGEGFLPGKEEEQQWIEKISGLFKKLHYLEGKTILSKNPFHSLRIPLLIKIFPNARFIHIGRKPEEVVPSTVNMWTILQNQNALNRGHQPPQVKEVVAFMEKMHQTLVHDLSTLSPGRVATVRYEELETDPIACLKEVYKGLQLPFTAEERLRVEAYLRENEGYRKNSFTLSSVDQETIRTGLPQYRTFFGYQD